MTRYNLEIIIHLKLQIVVSPVVDQLLDIVAVVDGEPEEEEGRQDGEDSHQDTELLDQGQTLDWSRSWSHQHLLIYKCFSLKILSFKLEPSHSHPAPFVIICPLPPLL